MSREIPCVFCSRDLPDPNCAGCHGKGFIIDTGGEETVPMPVEGVPLAQIAVVQPMNPGFVGGVIALDVYGRVWNVAMDGQWNWERVPLPQESEAQREA
jgi:hypothetical protein